MTLNFYQEETNSQTASMNSVCNQVIQSMEQTISSIYSFQFANNLQGQAYRSAKSYMMEIYLPLAKGIISLCEEIKSQNDTYPSNFRSQVSSADVVEVEITEQINQIQTMIEHTKDTSLATFLVTPIVSVFEEIKQTLQRKLNNLYAFEASSSGNYEMAVQLAEQVAKGLAQIQNNNGFNNRNGTFSSTGMDLEWLTELDRLHYKRLAYEKFGEYMQTEEADLEKAIAVLTYEERNPDNAALTTDFLDKLEERDIVEIKYLMYTAEEPYRTISMKYLDRFTISSTTSGGVFRPGENTISFNIKENRTDSRGSYYTVFHEIMHAADYYHGVDQGYDEYFSDHFHISGANLTNYMNQDAQNHFQQEISNILDSSDYDHLDVREKQIMKENVAENLMIQDDLYAQLSPEERKLNQKVRAHYEDLLEGAEHNTASDVYGGITNYTITGNFGHFDREGNPTDYWFVDGIGGSDGERIREPNREGIAEYYGRLMTENDEKRRAGLESIEEFLPTSKESMEEIFDAIVE